MEWKNKGIVNFLLSH